MTRPVIILDDSADLHLFALGHAVLTRAASALARNGRPTEDHPTLSGGEFAAGGRPVGSWLVTPDPLPPGFDDATNRHLETVHLVVDLMGVCQRVGVFSADTRGFCLTTILRSPAKPVLRCRASVSSWLLGVLSDISVVHPADSAMKRETDNLFDRYKTLGQAAAIAANVVECAGHVMLPSPTEEGSNDVDDVSELPNRSIALPQEANPSCRPRLVAAAFDHVGAEGLIGKAFVEWRRHLQMPMRPAMMTWHADLSDPLACIQTIRDAEVLLRSEAA